MLILTLKIGQRLYISQPIGIRLIVEVVDIVRHDVDKVQVKFEVKTELLNQGKKKSLSNVKNNHETVNTNQEVHDEHIL